MRRMAGGAERSEENGAGVADLVRTICFRNLSRRTAIAVVLPHPGGPVTNSGAEPCATHEGFRLCMPREPWHVCGGAPGLNPATYMPANVRLGSLDLWRV